MAGGNWIAGAIKRPGAFRAKAERAGKSTAQYASEVKANPSRHDKTTVRQANLAGTLGRMSKRRGGRQHARRSSRR